MRGLLAGLVVAIALLAPRGARAQELRVGLYAPSAPFAGTSARLDFVTRLARHLGAATGRTGRGKVYARAADFAGAVRAGQLDVAVVDPAYLAVSGAAHPVLATATRRGAAETAWQLVSRGGEGSILELRGKKLLCAAIGGREADFVYDALLGGELPRGFFAEVSGAPDVLSALAALGLGRADVAVVPAGVELPAGVRPVADLPPVSGPVLVAIGASAEDRRKLAAAATRFAGGEVLDGFTAGGEPGRTLGHRSAKRVRRGPMVIPTLRVAVDELVARRRPTIAPVDVRELIAPLPPLPDP
jgi:ABC-type amino acid transport substrate-binding protein